MTRNRFIKSVVDKLCQRPAHPLFHRQNESGLRAIVEANPNWQVVGEAVDGREAIGKSIEVRPDIAIIDYSLPVLNGIEATRLIHARLPAAELLIFTMHDSEALVGELLASTEALAVAFTRAGRSLLPAPDVVLAPGDILLVSATLAGIEALRERAAPAG